MAPKGKKVVSTSGIFKKGKDDKQDLKSAWKPSKIRKAAALRKEKSAPQHPLAEKFTGVAFLCLTSNSFPD